MENNCSLNEKTKMVIAGGGFAGFNAARYFEDGHRRDAGIDFDRNFYHSGDVLPG